MRNVINSFIEILQFLKDRVEIYTNKFSLEAIMNDKRMTEDIKPKVYSGDDRINRIVTLGGDGTILYAIKMFFNKEIPPIISFGLGSVGYLCSFEASSLREVLEDIFMKVCKAKSMKTIARLNEDINNNYVAPYIIHRDRLEVTFSKESQRDSFQVESNVFKNGIKKFEGGSYFNALNEFTIEAEAIIGQFTLEIYVDGHFLAEVTACGLIFSTPTGSTAYSMSAGGSILQTEVKAMCITAIKPSTLSFRPLIIPLKSKVTLKVPEGRNDTTFRGCIDGDFKFEMMEGDQIEITGSEKPVPFVTKDSANPIASWIKRLKSTVLKY